MPKEKPFLADKLLQYHANEVAAYHTLRNFQGELMPRLLEDIDLHLTPPSSPDDELFYVKGIIHVHKHVNGFYLQLMTDHVLRPRGARQDIVDQALAASYPPPWRLQHPRRRPLAWKPFGFTLERWPFPGVYV